MASEAQPAPTKGPSAGPPPGPSSRLLTTYRVLTDPFRWMPRWRETYGDPFLLPTLNGDVAMTGDPERLKLIFGHDPSLYDPFAADAVAPLLGPTALVIESGERHLRDRKLLMPPFHGERMRAYARTMAEVAERHLGRASDSGAAITALRLGQDISLEVIIRAVFGVTEPARVDAFREQIIAFMEGFAPVLSFASFLQRGWFGPWRRFRGHFDAFDAMLSEQIARIRSRGLGDDILSLMLEARYDDGAPMPDSEIRDQLRMLLVAGHETTAVTLAWIIDALGRHDEVLEEAREVAGSAPDDPSAWGKLPFIRAICDETMRRWPVVTETMRVLKAPLEFGGYRLEAGQCVGAGILLAHLREDIYPDPWQWRPQRFMERRFGPFEFLPFGGGHRRCIGAAFSTMEMQLVVTALLRSYEVRLAEIEAPPAIRRNIVMAPKGGVPIRVQRLATRRAAA